MAYAAALSTPGAPSLGGRGLMVPGAPTLGGGLYVPGEVVPPDPTRWTIGLTSTPDYVPVWTRPSSVAAGKANGSIPSNALAFETGNGGSAFATLTDWVNAANALGVPMCIETNVNMTATGIARCYNDYDIFGAGAVDLPKLLRTDRSSGSRGTWLMVRRRNFTIWGLDVAQFEGVVGVVHPRTALVKSGAVDPDPYFTGGDPAFAGVNSTTAADFYVQQHGTIRLSGAVSISQMVIKRQTPAVDASGITYGAKTDDLLWQATLTDVVTLFSGQACTTAAQVVTAINANMVSTGFAAELNEDGDVRLMPTSKIVRPPWEINPTYTGAGSVTTDTKTPQVTFAYCRFTDCNHVYSAYLDVACLGFVRYYKVEAPGTYSLLSAPVCQWEGLEVANVKWYDCMATRTNTPGRVSSQLPDGNSFSTRNTCFMIGNDSPVGMRYHGAAGGNHLLFENNHAENIESLVGNRDTVNAAVFLDARNNWKRTVNNRPGRVAYNYVKHVVGIRGAEDSNAWYFKPRGLDFVANYNEDYGAAWYSSTQNGTEASNTDKNPGNYYTTVAGVAAAGGGAEPEDTNILGNTFKAWAEGTPAFKWDEKGGYLRAQGNLFEGPWVNARNGAYQTNGASSGVTRITNHQLGVRWVGNRYRNLNPGTAPRFVLNMWTQTLLSGLSADPTRYLVAANEWVNDVTSFADDTALATLDAGFADSTFRTNFPTGDNRILNADLSDTGKRWLFQHQSSGAQFLGANTATGYPRYDTYDYLQSYGYIGPLH